MLKNCHLVVLALNPSPYSTKPINFHQICMNIICLNVNKSYLRKTLQKLSINHHKELHNDYPMNVDKFDYVTFYSILLWLRHKQTNHLSILSLLPSPRISKFYPNMCIWYVGNVDQHSLIFAKRMSPKQNSTYKSLSLYLMQIKSHHKGTNWFIKQIYWFMWIVIAELERGRRFLPSILHSFHFGSSCS